MTTINNDKIRVISKLKNDIENMDKTHHKHFFLIIKNSDMEFTENKNGIFINITNLNDEVISNFQKKIEYIKKQEKQLSDVEDQKMKYKQLFDKCQ